MQLVEFLGRCSRTRFSKNLDPFVDQILLTPTKLRDKGCAKHVHSISNLRNESRPHHGSIASVLDLVGVAGASLDLTKQIVLCFE